MIQKCFGFNKYTFLTPAEKRCLTANTIMGLALIVFGLTYFGLQVDWSSFLNKITNEKIIAALVAIFFGYILVRLVILNANLEQSSRQLNYLQAAIPNAIQA